MVIVPLVIHVAEFVIVKLRKTFCELCDEICCFIVLKKVYGRPIDNGRGVSELLIVFM
jgi:hypothetical protein